MTSALLAPALAGSVLAFAQVVLIDVSLAGDNAVAVGLAAAGLPEKQRKRAIFYGLACAVVLLVGFALIAVQLLKIVGLLLAGGVLLLWVSWKIWQDLRESHAAEVEAGEAALEGRDCPPGTQPKAKTFMAAMIQILVADISMSLDNVLAVAGAARQHPQVLIFGLVLSVTLMGVAATWIAKLLHRFRWIGYVGLAIVLFVSLKMVWEGHREVVVRTGHAAEYNAVMPGLLDLSPEEIADYRHR